MPTKGVLRVFSNTELDAMEQERLDVERDMRDGEQRELAAIDELAAHIRKEFERMRWHRNKFNLPQRYLACLRQFNGNYSGKKLAEIAQFGGSQVFAQLTAVKCRGASALLRDVFLSEDRPWTLEPTPVPEIPDDVSKNIDQLIQVEMQTMQQAGETVDPTMVEERRQQLLDAATKATLQRAYDEAAEAEEYLDDDLREGGFYQAMMEFLMDLTIFPLAILKGPEIKRKVSLSWTDGELSVKNPPRMFWRRVSPFDIYFSPGASRIEDADVIERIKLSRKDLNMLLDLPAYRQDAIRAVLRDYENGRVDYFDDAETERANEENRENPYINDSELIDTLEYHGAVKGAWLEEFGFQEIEDPDKDYHVTAWLCGEHVLKVHLNPNPKQRHPYYVTCFEKIPGSIVGNALPEIIADAQEVANASFRSLVNNMSIASGPQVMVNEERLAPTMDANTLYPWKRWRYISDPLMQEQQTPVSFFQPKSNADELLGVYRAMMEIMDEVSAIPRYVTGNGAASGGAASTASGLSMLMNNASKVLQNIASCIDDDIIRPVLEDLYIIKMMTDTKGKLRGDESIVVRGVAVAAAKEMDRMRQIEFMQLTGNPMDMQIIGMNGRAAILRSVASKIGLPQEEIVPTRDQLKIQQAQMQQQAQLEAAAQAQGGQSSTGGNERLSEETDNMHIARNMPGGPQR